MRKVFALLLIILSINAFAQDRQYVLRMVEELSAPEMQGRGFVNDGCKKAAYYLADEMEKLGLSEVQLQKYSFPINTFPRKMKVKVDGKTLTPGYDYVVHPRNSGQKATFDLVWLPDTITRQTSVYQLIDTTDLTGKMVVFPTAMESRFSRGIKGIHNAIFLRDKCYWFTSHGLPANHDCQFMMRSDALPKDAKRIKVDFESEFIGDFEAYNVMGCVIGNACPDSTIVFTAHYDHLGMMGKQALFPGANDNATGTAFVMSMAQYYAQHPEKAHYTMWFILLSGEEAGLFGSSFNAEHPSFDLDKTRLLINFDMVGTGSEGIQMVNSTVFPDITQVMREVNAEHKCVETIKDRGESCNSDHCPYYQQGVPALFIYTLGSENNEYHTVTDTPDKTQFTAYEGFFELITKTAERANEPIFNRKP